MEATYKFIDEPIIFSKISNFENITQTLTQPREDELRQLSDYIILPRTVYDQKISPLTTGFFLNGTPVNHQTKWKATTGYVFGDNRNDNVDFLGVVKINGKISESLTKVIAHRNKESVLTT